MLPPQKTFVKYLKDNVTRSTLYDALDVKKTTIDHWFRNDKYFSYPSMEDWEKLKPYLKVIKYDEEMTTIESFEWQKQKWQTPLVTSSRPSTKRIAEGINPKGNLAENPDVYKDEYIIEPWETVPRTIEDEEKRVDKIKALEDLYIQRLSAIMQQDFANPNFELPTDGFLNTASKRSLIGRLMESRKMDAYQNLLPPRIPSEGSGSAIIDGSTTTNNHSSNGVLLPAGPAVDGFEPYAT